MIIDEGGPAPALEDEDEEDESLPDWLEEVNKVAARHDDIDEDEAKEAEEAEESANLTPAQRRMRTLITGKGAQEQKKVAEEEESEDELVYS